MGYLRGESDWFFKSRLLGEAIRRVRRCDGNYKVNAIVSLEQLCTLPRLLVKKQLLLF